MIIGLTTADPPVASGGRPEDHVEWSQDAVAAPDDDTDAPLDVIKESPTDA